MVEGSIVGILTTLRKDGRPVALPIWFVVLDGKIYISTRGKKVDRLRHDQRCSLLVEAGERWADLRAVHLDCVGRVIEPSDELAERIAKAMATKYAAYRTERRDMPSATREAYRKAIGAILELEPADKMLNWDNRRLFSPS
jgi:hypothetical protein